ncbi:phosphate signaling complex protein PhoU [Corynebacterium renale]|uniref:Phosphate transport system protein n=1 Tax=Corynebacterium renale TaxID=1724 RepID=A0A2A9DQ92_9CORY|nr:phosphate signaling complex protein PhoU [Corynebacterium renale]PFG28080.1 phosphate transport system protein [Corynebacterium renale]SQI20811.1 phosphate uptake regulator [Corynebacterium renale]
MRTAYREHLDAFAHDLIVLCDLDKEVLEKATRALIHCSLEAAEDALSMEDKTLEIVQRCEARAVELLALEAPVASDLRQVVSSIYIVEDLRRMAALARNIASTARQRHPHRAIPDDLVGYFEEMSHLGSEMVMEVRDLLIDPDPDAAARLSDEDDAVDDIHDHLKLLLTARPWSHSTREAYDVAMCGRFFERYADHCVNVATRIIYLTTGKTRAEYLDKRKRERDDAELSERLAHLERQISGRNA